MKTKEQLQTEINNLVKINFLNSGRYKYLAHTLNNIIEDDEDIKIICTGKYNNKQLEILSTNKRILMVNSGIVPQRSEIRIEKINSLILQSKGITTSLHIIVSGTEFIIENISKCQEFMNIVNEQINNYKSFKIEINRTTEKDITDKIQRLAELHKEGILTDYEFSTKKMELLEQLKK